MSDAGRLHHCSGCGVELDGDDPREQCSECSTAPVAVCPHGHRAPINCGLCAGIDG